MSTPFGIVKTTSVEIVDTSLIDDNISICNATFGNFDKICRLCLGYENLKPFFDMTYKQASVQNIIYDCSSLKVNPEDGLPYNLCETCITELIRFYRFKNRCIQVSSVLQDAYNNRNFTKEEEPTIQTIGSQGYGINEVTLIIKNEEIKDPLSIDSECILEDTNRVNLIIKDDEIENTATICEDLIVKYEESVDGVSICNDNIPKGYIDNETEDVISSNNWDYNEMVYIKEHTGTPSSKPIVIHPYNCSVCERSFQLKCHLIRHMLIHTGEKPHKCNVCKKSFRQKYTLNLHMLTHTGETPHKCSVCDMSFSYKSSLQNHILIHTDKRPNKCNVCEKLFKSKSQLNRHMLIHSGEKPHQCSVCKDAFRYKCNLNTHMLIHTGEKPHTCSICKKSFIQKWNLHVHMLIHTNNNLIVKNEEILDVVTLCSHNIEEECDDGNTINNKFKNVISRNNEVQPQEYKQTTCSKTTMIYPHNCSVCKKSFQQEPCLNRHMLTHSSDGRHKCRICGKSFTQNSYLVKHISIHTGEKPHKCSICMKSFRKKDHLQSHMVLHTGKRLHKCSVCEKSFGLKSTLDPHMLVHTDKMEHKCSVCEKPFSRKPNLNVHMLTHYAEIVKDKD